MIPTALAAVNFDAIHVATATMIPVMIACWALFLSIPLGIVGISRMLDTRPGHNLPGESNPGSGWQVKTAKNGRLYAYRAGMAGCMWARKGESAEDLLARAWFDA